jgi:hypothetical protein
MRISKRGFCILATTIIFVFAAQPLVQAGQGLEDWWKVEDVKGDDSTGCLTIYYQVVSYDGDVGEELALMVFSLRIYEKKTKTWHLINGVADTTVLLTSGVNNTNQRQELQDFLDNSVLPKLCQCGYTSIHLTGVENDYHNLILGTYGSRAPYFPPYVVGADITLVAK